MTRLDRDRLRAHLDAVDNDGDGEFTIIVPAALTDDDAVLRILEDACEHIEALHPGSEPMLTATSGNHRAVATTWQVRPLLDELDAARPEVDPMSTDAHQQDVKITTRFPHPACPAAIAPTRRTD